MIVSSSWSMLTACSANLSECSVPLMLQCAGIYCRITLLCSNMLYSLGLRFCSPCPTNESNTDRESVRYTTSSELASVRSITVELLVLGFSLQHCSLCSIFL